jgi:membrane fusion protein (multidrug efflux system)
MPVELTENRDVDREEAGRIETRSPGEGVSIEQGNKSSQMIPPPGRQSKHRRRLLMGVLGALILAAVGIFGIPWTRLALSTVSTDDAYVNGHVTFVAPPVSGQISRVLVDDNYRVRKGEVNTDAMARTTQLVQQGFVKITE